MRLAACLLVLSLTLPAVAPAKTIVRGAKPRVVVLSLQGIDGGRSVEAVRASLERVKGVKKVTFDTRTVEATVELASAVPTAKLLSAVEETGYLALEGPGQGRWMPPKGFPEGSDVGIVSESGDDIPQLETLAVPGKVTVVDFYADWCRPCRMIDAHMNEILGKRQDVAVRKINIVDWNTPAARQVLRYTSGIPFMVVYGKKGEKAGTVAGFQPRELEAALDRGAAQ